MWLPRQGEQHTWTEVGIRTLQAWGNAKYAVQLEGQVMTSEAGQDIKKQTLKALSILSEV